MQDEVRHTRGLTNFYRTMLSPRNPQFEPAPESVGPTHAPADPRCHLLEATAIVLEQVGEDWYARAREARVKKFGRSRPAEFRDKARQMRFLQYRGFEPDQVQAAVSAFEE